MKIRNLLFLLTLTLSICFLPSCSNSTEDELKTLLQTVPADASVVGVANLESLGEKLDKQHLHKDSLKSMLANVIGLYSESDQESFEGLLNGKAGIKEGCMVYFEATHQYLTGMIENEKDFKAYIEKYTGSKFQKEGAFQVAGNAAYTGSQFWLQLQGAADVEELTSLTRLTKTQSFASTKYADHFIKLDHDFDMVTSLRRYLQMSSRNSMEMNLLSSALFDEATYAGITFDLTGDKKSPLGCEMNLYILNSNFKPAKFLLPTAVINQDAINKMDGRAINLFAMAISPKLVDKVAKMAASFGGSLPQQLLDALKCLDGTMAVATDGTNLQGFITTKKGDSGKLEKMLQNYTNLPYVGQALAEVDPLKFNSEGNTIRFWQGILPAGKEVREVTPQFKDAMIVFWTDSFNYGDYMKDENVPFNGSMMMKVMPKDGSLVVSVAIK